MRRIAAERGVPIYDPERLNDPASTAGLAGFGPELLVVADYGQILSAAALGTAARGGLNLHGSLLPRYRGAAPINWALHHGDAETGVSVIQMSTTVDAGPVLAQARTAIGPEETAPELERRLAELGAPLVVEVIARMARGESISPVPQDPTRVCGARRLRKSDGEVDWTRQAEAIGRQVRALEPWPRTATSWLRAGGPAVRLILGRTIAEPGTEANVVAGTVIEAERERLVVATGAGRLRLLEVQPAGKRMMSAGEFLRGHPVQAGDRMGSESGG
jgi:methionyl-tRNA formyltransferase